jgi:ABC-2 type transport system ATP-binding protein
LINDPNVPAVRLDGVTKRFGKHTAVSSLDLEIPAGSIYGLLGPNGSGKTTTIRMIMGILLPDEGRVTLFDGDPDETRRKSVGYLPEERGVYRKMKVVDLLVFLGEIRGVHRGDGRRRALDWLERLGLGEWADHKVEDLSKGMQQKVQFIGTVIHEPRLLILDEPFSGLDPINQDVLEEIVLELNGRGTTILFSTHLMDHAERLCSRVCLISRAAKVLDGDLREIKREARSGVVAVAFEGDDERWMAGADVLRVEPTGAGFNLLMAPDADPNAILRRGLDSGAQMTRFQVVEPSLHQIFVTHAGSVDEDEAAQPLEVVS